MISPLSNQTLARYTSFGVGGPAETLYLPADSTSLIEVLGQIDGQPNILGYGSNSLISDKGLPGTTIVCNGGNITFIDDVVEVDAGVWWDDLVQQSVERGLWGLELMSQIPGSVGAACKINITAYGASFGQRTVWVEAFDPATKLVKRFSPSELEWSYKNSVFIRPANDHLVITRVCLQLSKNQLDNLTYESALMIAKDRHLDHNSLYDRRQIIVLARFEAQSIWLPESDYDKTVGSFFRNPYIDEDQVAAIVAHDETGKTTEQILNMNRVHGGSATRVSAAHVLIAAGFKRGQVFEQFGGNVRLHPDHVLKIENFKNASAQEIYNAASHIQQVVKQNLNIQLEAEAVYMGEFDEA